MLTPSPIIRSEWLGVNDTSLHRGYVQIVALQDDLTYCGKIFLYFIQTSNFLAFNSVSCPHPPCLIPRLMSSKPSAAIFLALLCFLSLYAPTLHSLCSLFVAEGLSSFQSALTSHPRPSLLRRRCRRRLDGPGFIYVFQVKDGTGHLLFKVGCTNNITRRRREWHQKCIPIKHSWCRRCFPTLLAFQHGMCLLSPCSLFLTILRASHSSSAASQRISPYQRTLSWGQLCVIPLPPLPSNPFNPKGHTHHKEIFEYLGDMAG